MKIYWSNVFDDYLFVEGNKVTAMIHSSSLNPQTVIWEHFPISHFNGLELITEIK